MERKFSTRVMEYQGNPVIEILCYGAPFGETYTFDKDFRFGLKKAKMILTCEEIIYFFYQSDGRLPESDEKIGIYKATIGIACICGRFDSFPHSFGRTINKPYLRIDSGETHIGLGTIKAGALMDVIGDIKRFVEKYKSEYEYA